MNNSSLRSVLVLACLGLPAFIAVSAIWKGYVLSVLWAWFLVAHFSAPALSIPLAIGVSLIVGLLTAKVSPQDAEADPKFGWTVAISLIGPAGFLLLGWIVKAFL